jgi:hypothetical protein
METIAKSLILRVYEVLMTYTRDRAQTMPRSLTAAFFLTSRAYARSFGYCVGTGLYTQASFGLMLFPCTNVTLPFAK